MVVDINIKADYHDSTSVAQKLKLIQVFFKRARFVFKLNKNLIEVERGLERVFFSC